MINKRLTILNSIVVALLMVLTTSCFSQVSTKNVYKKYVQTDSVLINKSAVLILYNNNTFINYGIMTDWKNDDVYVWFTSGKWKKKNAEITCKSSYNLFDKEQIISDVKAYYKGKILNNTDVSTFDFVHEKYMDYVYVVIKDKAFDVNKKIYYEEKEVDETKPFLLNVFN